MLKVIAKIPVWPPFFQLILSGQVQVQVNWVQTRLYKLGKPHLAQPHQPS